jgi:hypothetical protein
VAKLLEEGYDMAELKTFSWLARQSLLLTFFCPIVQLTRRSIVALLVLTSQFVLADGASARVFVCNGATGFLTGNSVPSVAYFDVGSPPEIPSVVNTIDTGGNPQAVAIALNRWVCVCNAEGTVSVIDGLHPTDPFATVPVGSNPISIAIAADKYACVHNIHDGTVSVFDVTNPLGPVSTVTVTEMFRFYRVFPVSTLAIAANKYVCVCNPNANTVAVFDATNPSGPVSIVNVGDFPIAIAIAQGKYACVCNQNDNTVSVFDATNPASGVTTVDVGNHPIAVAIAGDRYACVCNLYGHTVSIFDVTNPSGGVVTVEVGYYPHVIAIAGDVYACVGNNYYNVSVFNVTNLPPGIAPTVSVPGNPVAIAIDDNQYAFVSQVYGPFVSFFDATNPPPYASGFFAGSRPIAMAILPLPPVVEQPEAFTGAIHRYGSRGTLRMKWKRSPSPDIQRYVIFACGKRIASIPAQNELKYKIHLHSPCLKKKHLSKEYLYHLHEKYKIRAVNIDGLASEFVQLDVKE